MYDTQALRVEETQVGKVLSISLPTHIHTYRYVVGVVFGCEHLLLLVSLWLRYAIHPTPKRVRLAIARRNYLLSRQSACQREPERESETVGDKEKAD